MKKIIIIYLFFTISLSSVNAFEIGDSYVFSSPELNEVINNYISTNYPELTILQDFIKTYKTSFEKYNTPYQYSGWVDTIDELLNKDTSIINNIGLEFLTRILKKYNGYLYPDALIWLSEISDLINKLGKDFFLDNINDYTDERLEMFIEIISFFKAHIDSQETFRQYAKHLKPVIFNNNISSVGFNHDEFFVPYINLIVNHLGIQKSCEYLNKFNFGAKYFFDYLNNIAVRDFGSPEKNEFIKENYSKIVRNLVEISYNFDTPEDKQFYNTSESYYSIDNNLFFLINDVEFYFNKVKEYRELNKQTKKTILKFNGSWKMEWPMTFDDCINDFIYVFEKNSKNTTPKECIIKIIDLLKIIQGSEIFIDEYFILDFFCFLEIDIIEKIKELSENELTIIYECMIHYKNNLNLIKTQEEFNQYFFLFVNIFDSKKYTQEQFHFLSENYIYIIDNHKWLNKLGLEYIEHILSYFLIR